jgi:hypothetical protein
MRGAAGEIRKLLLGLSFDEQGDEVANRCIVEPAMHGSYDLMDGCRRHLRKPSTEAIHGWGPGSRHAHSRRDQQFVAS